MEVHERAQVDDARLRHLQPRVELRGLRLSGCDGCLRWHAERLRLRGCGDGQLLLCAQRGCLCRSRRQRLLLQLHQQGQLRHQLHEKAELLLTRCALLQCCRSSVRGRLLQHSSLHLHLQLRVLLLQRLLSLLARLQRSARADQPLLQRRSHLLACVQHGLRSGLGDCCSVHVLQGGLQLQLGCRQGLKQLPAHRGVGEHEQALQLQVRPHLAAAVRVPLALVLGQADGVHDVLEDEVEEDLVQVLVRLHHDVEDVGQRHDGGVAPWLRSTEGLSIGMKTATSPTTGRYICWTWLLQVQVELWQTPQQVQVELWQTPRQLALQHRFKMRIELLACLLPIESRIATAVVTAVVWLKPHAVRGARRPAKQHCKQADRAFAERFWRLHTAADKLAAALSAAAQASRTACWRTCAPAAASCTCRRGLRREQAGGRGQRCCRGRLGASTARSELQGGGGGMCVCVTV